MKEIAEKAQSTWDKFRKERDFHRLHHKRVVHEKDKLVVDIKRLKSSTPSTNQQSRSQGKVREGNEGKDARAPRVR